MTNHEPLPSYLSNPDLFLKREAFRTDVDRMLNGDIKQPLIVHMLLSSAAGATRGLPFAPELFGLPSPLPRP